MQKTNLYRYETGGVVKITPSAKAESDIPSKIRLISDEGCILTNGEIYTFVIDIKLDEVGLWDEVVEVEEVIEADLKAQAYDILMGVTE